MKSMHVVSRQGRVTAGFDAVRSLGAWLPLFWPLTLIAWVPGVAWVGRRVYNYLATTRPRDVPCTDDVCGIHPPSRSRRMGEPDRTAAQTESTRRFAPRR